MRRLLILSLFIALLAPCSTWAQQTDTSKIKVLMMAGKKLLAQGDSLEAKKKFEQVLELDPDMQSAKTLIESISASINDSVEKLEKLDNIDNVDAIDSIASNPVPANPFANAIKKKPATANRPLAKPMANPIKQEQKPAVVDDQLLAAFKRSNSEHIFNFRCKPGTALISKASKDTASPLQGHYISSIRNQRDNGHEMLTLTLDSITGKAEFDNTLSEFLILCQNAGYQYSAPEPIVSNDAIDATITIGLNATKRNEVITLADALLSPFLGECNVANYELFRWMQEGETVVDTIVTERTVCDTLMYFPPTQDSIFCDTIVRDTAYHERIVIPEYFAVNLRVNLHLEKCSKILPGTISIRMDADTPHRRLLFTDITMPCTFVQAPPQYQWTQVGKAVLTDEEERWLSELKAAGKDMHTLNNLGYALLNGIDGTADINAAREMFLNAYKLKSKEACANLYLVCRDGGEDDFEKALSYLREGREKQSADALFLSAELMLSFGGDAETILKWLNDAREMGSTDAILMLADMNERGILMDKNADEAMRLYSLARDMQNTDAGYYVAQMMLTDGSASQAFSQAVASAQFGSAKAMQLLAEMYITGITVKPNPAKAKSWLKRLQETVTHRKIGFRHEKN